jgi:hypothetical protein
MIDFVCVLFFFDYVRPTFCLHAGEHDYMEETTK